MRGAGTGEGGGGAEGAGGAGGAGEGAGADHLIKSLEAEEQVIICIFDLL